MDRAPFGSLRPGVAESGQELSDQEAGALACSFLPKDPLESGLFKTF